MVPFLDKGLQWVNVKRKPFRQIQAYPGIIQAYSERCVTLAYSQLWYIQNTGTFKTLSYSKSKTYSEPCQTSTMKRFAKIVNGFHCLHKL